MIPIQQGGKGWTLTQTYLKTVEFKCKRLRCCAAHHFDMQENGCELDKKWTTWALYRLGGIILLHKACPAVFCVYCIYTHGSRILLPHRCFTRVRPTPSVTPSANISSTACRKWNEEVRIIVQKIHGTTLLYIIKHVSENKKFDLWMFCGTKALPFSLWFIK